MSKRRTGPGRAHQARAPWLILMLSLLAACAPLYADPGPQPALARVRLDLGPDPSAMPVGAKEMSRQVRWDWGLYLVDARGGLTRLRPRSGQRLDNLALDRLRADEVFLAPPGRHRLRLLAEGYVGARYGMGLAPYTVALIQEDLDLDLVPGQEVTITRVCPAPR